MDIYCLNSHLNNCIILYTDMKLSEIFTSSAKTAVLETLAQFDGELHLRRIAELSEQNVHAVDVVLKSLKKERVVKARPKRQRIYFSLNMGKMESRIVKALIEAKESQDSFHSEMDISRRVTKMLSFTDSVYEMKNRVKSLFPLNKIMEMLLSTFKKLSLTPILAEDLAINIYRDELRNINNITLICPIQDKNWQRTLKHELSQKFLRNDFKINLSNQFIEITPNSQKHSCIPILVRFEKAPKNVRRANINEFEVYVPRIEDVIAESSFRIRHEKNAEFLIDDVQNIFQSKRNYSLVYLLSLLTKRNVPLHPSSYSYIPSLLKRASREIEVNMPSPTKLKAS